MNRTEASLVSDPRRTRAVGALDVQAEDGNMASLPEVCLHVSTYLRPNDKA